MWHVFALEKNVDFLPMAKPVFAINHLGIRRNYVWSFRWHWWSGSPLWRRWFLLILCNKESLSEICEMEIQGDSIADLRGMSTFLWIGKYSWVVIESNPEKALLSLVMNTHQGKCLVRKYVMLHFVHSDSSYLVDPASSHMLVSKIKPCMSKYKQICTVKLRMAH